MRDYILHSPPKTAREERKALKEACKILLSMKDDGVDKYIYSPPLTKIQKNEKRREQRLVKIALKLLSDNF